MIEYEDGNLWFTKKGNLLTIGISLASVDEIGEAESVNLPSVGDDFDKEDVLCEVTGVDGTIKVFTPAAGFISEVNELLAEDIEVLNEDPIDEGWLVKIEMQDETDLKEYL